MAFSSRQQALPITHSPSYSSFAPDAMIWDKKQISNVSTVLSGKIRQLNDPFRNPVYLLMAINETTTV
jgi:hypothetical protein